MRVILLLIPALDYYPLRDPFPDLINPVLAVLSSGFLILVRHLVSNGRARTAAGLPSTINLDEATALLLPVIPQRYEGDLPTKLARSLDSWSWFYSAANALSDIFALAAFFGSNNKLDPSQIVDFLKWINTHNHAVDFTLFMAIRTPTVNAFATVVVESAIRTKSVQTLEILFDCGVKLDGMLNRIALLEGAGNLTHCVLSGMSLASLAATGVGVTEDPRAGGPSLAVVFDPPGRSNLALARAHIAGLEQVTARRARQPEKDLEESIRGKDFAAAMTLFQSGVSPDGPTFDTPPLEAAMQSDVIGHGFVQLLLEHGADPNREGLLETLVGTGRSDLLEMFLARPMDLERRTKALVIAARAGNIASAAMLIKTPGMDIDTPGLPLNPLQAAAGTGMDRGIGMVVFLLEKGANVNAPAHPNRGRTALQAALEFAPTFEIAETLLRYGADATAPPAEDYGITALEALCDNPYVRGNPRLIDMLLAAGATVNRPGGSQAQCFTG